MSNNSFGSEIILGVIDEAIEDFDKKQWQLFFQQVSTEAPEIQAVINKLMGETRIATERSGNWLFSSKSPEPVRIDCDGSKLVLSGKERVLLQHWLIAIQKALQAKS